MKLILLGAPGAGKGTQAEILKKKLEIPTISTGNILRAAVKNGTPTGLKAKEYMDAGKLVPDEVIIGIINDRLQEPDCANGYILDGVPRTIAQAEAMEQAGISFDAVVAIEIPDEKIVARMGGRRVCEHCGASYHIVNIPPKTEGVCDVCGGKLVFLKSLRYLPRMPRPSDVPLQVTISLFTIISSLIMAIRWRKSSICNPNTPLKNRLRTM